MPAALAYWRANKLDKVMLGRPDARFGIVTVGKSYLDVRQALDELGIDDAEAERLGLADLQGRHGLAARDRGRRRPSPPASARSW